jgi:transcriptional regulator with XRE-family HTH domain
MDGATLKRRRQAANVAQAELAAAVGVSRSTVSHWETDRATPSSAELRRIERALSTASTPPDASSRPGIGSQKVARREVHADARRHARGMGALLKLDAARFAEAASIGGVFVLFSAAGKPIWVGKTRNLRRKLKRLAREPWFGQASHATLLVIHRRRMRAKVLELARELTSLAAEQRR